MPFPHGGDRPTDVPEASDQGRRRQARLPAGATWGVQQSLSASVTLIGAPALIALFTFLRPKGIPSRAAAAHGKPARLRGGQGAGVDAARQAGIERGGRGRGAVTTMWRGRAGAIQVSATSEQDRPCQAAPVHVIPLPPRRTD